MVVICTKWSPRMGSVDIELVRGYYTCIRCGSHMATLLWTQVGGRLIIKMEPLICPHCATTEERREANERLWQLRHDY